MLIRLWESGSCYGMMRISGSTLDMLQSSMENLPFEGVCGGEGMRRGLILGGPKHGLNKLKSDPWNINPYYIAPVDLNIKLVPCLCQ